MRINNAYVKKTENESTFMYFSSKIGKFFRYFTRKTLYSKNVCDIMDKADGLGESFVPSNTKSSRKTV